MKFLYPEVLWGLTVLLIPIIIHLFNFKRYKTLYFSSLQFIKKVDQEAKSTKQLKRWLILLSRLLALSALIIAFSQPYWSNEEKSTLPGRPILIHVDNSFSMQAQGYEGELLSMAKEKIRNVIQSLPNNQLFIISTNALTGREEQLLNKADAFEKVDQIDFSGLSKRIDQVISWQKQTIRKHDPEEKWLNVENYIFSDFQRINGTALSDNADFNFTPVLLHAENTENLFIDSLWFDEPINRIGRSNRLNISVQNNSDQDLTNVELEFSGDAENKVLFVDLPARIKTKTAITVTNKKDGLKSGSVRIADQNIYFDDAFYYSYVTEKQVNVLILNGEDASENVPLIYSLDQYYNLVQLDYLSFTRENLKEKDLIVLNGINKLPSGVSNLLDDAIKSGTSIGIFPGRSPDIADFNLFLSKHKLPSMGSAITAGNRIDQLNYDDPFFEGVFDKRSEKLNLPGISRTFIAPGGGSASNTLIKLVNGTPLLVNRKETGNIYMFYSSLHPEFGNFVKDALCSTIFLRIGERSKRLQPMYVELGKQSTYPVYSDLGADQTIKIKNDQLSLIPQQSSINQVTYIQLNQINGIEELKAGNYQLISDRPVGIVSLNYSRKESQLDGLDKGEIESLFDSKGNFTSVKEISSKNQFDPSEMKKASGAWRLFIVLALIFVAIEMLLIRFLK